MSLIPERDKPALRLRLGSLRFPVRIACILRESGCGASREIHDLLNDLKVLSPMIDVETYFVEHDPAATTRFDIPLVPSIVLRTDLRDHTGHEPSGECYGIRFAGVPRQYELVAFLDAVEMAGTGKIDVRSDLLKKLGQITTPVHIRIFVTTASPYCPSAVITAHRLAMANRHIRSEMIDAAAFPDVAEKYDVHGVPRVVINEETAFEGSLPDDLYIDEVLRAAELPILHVSDKR